MSYNKYRRSYEDDRGIDNAPRWGHEGRRGRGTGFKHKYGRGRGGRNKALDYVRRYTGPRNNDFDELTEQDPVKWHKMSVIFGAQCTKEWILSKVQELSQDEINQLYNFQDEGRNVVAFFKARLSVVRQLRRQSQNFVDATGKRLTINVTCVKEPSISKLTDDIQTHIKLSLNKRYSFDTKTLDLSAFSKDKHLESVNCYLPLTAHVVAQYLVRILLENLSEMSSLNLSSNDLETLTNFKEFGQKFSNIKSLNVSYNRFRHDGVLDVFKGCQIESLNVQGNTFFKPHNFEHYGTQIRERFPNLLHLNGKLLPPRMKFGAGELRKKEMPKPTLGYFPSEEIGNGVIGFLKSFYEKYDSDKRGDLLEMYTDDAIMTFCVAPPTQDIRQKLVRYPDEVFNLSRNLLRVKEDDRRRKKVFRGKLQVVSTLDQLPKTEHFLDSFRVDVMYNNETSILMNINGVYREMEGHKTAIRVFSRTMQIEAPQKIKIDHFTICNPKFETDKKYRNQMNSIQINPSPSTSRNLDNSPSVPVVSPVPPVAANQDSLIHDMMRDTGMNFNFSKQCLADYDFNYQDAMSAFVLLKEASKIPAEAFT